jgi:hypothetical protein
LSCSRSSLTSRAVIRSIIRSSSASNNSELGAIISRSSLRDRHQDRLMVCSGCHGTDSVVASWETASHGSLEQTLSVAGIVDSLEEGELLRVQGSCRIQGFPHVLDSHVGVSNNLASLKMLRSRVVRGICICELSRNKIRHLNGDVECSVGLNSRAAV